MSRSHSAIFRESKLTMTEMQVRFLNPGTALAHARWTMSGAHMPPGGKP